MMAHCPVGSPGCPPGVQRERRDGSLRPQEGKKGNRPEGRREPDPGYRETAGRELLQGCRGPFSPWWSGCRMIEQWCYSFIVMGDALLLGVSASEQEGGIAAESSETFLGSKVLETPVLLIIAVTFAINQVA